jgi:hypothetical protein
VDDELLATSLAAVPPGLTSDRSAQALANLANTDFSSTGCGTATNPPCLNLQPSQITPQALTIMQMKAPDGSFWIANAATGTQLTDLQASPPTPPCRVEFQRFEPTR